MTKKTYTVSTARENEEGLIEITVIGEYATITKAMNAAKRAAHTRSDCQPYGPSSICYVGPEISAVVAW